MYSWANRRKIFIILVVAIVIVIPLIFLSFKLFYKAPTCFDNKQNQGEVGVDCGGPCSLVCPSNTTGPVVVWQRIFEIAPGLYNAAAYVQNPNIGAGATDVKYTIKVYDNAKRDLILFQREGVTKIYPRSNFPIVETSITTGERTAGRISFEFPSKIEWVKMVDEENNILIKNKILSNEDTAPRIDALIQNDSAKSYGTFEVAAIVYDNKDNALGVSKTIVDSLLKNSSSNLVFTWPKAFTSKASRIEIVPKF